MAGLTPVQLIKEPEAAALWTTKKLNVALNSGDVFVVCDAGGGTVDLVSYEVETTNPKLQVKEVVPGTGQRFIYSSSALRRSNFKLMLHTQI